MSHKIKQTEQVQSFFPSLMRLQNRTEQNRNVITLKLLQFLVTFHTYTTIYNFGDKTGHNNNG